MIVGYKAALELFRKAEFITSRNVHAFLRVFTLSNSYYEICPTNLALSFWTACPASSLFCVLEEVRAPLEAGPPTLECSVRLGRYYHASIERRAVIWRAVSNEKPKIGKNISNFENYFWKIQIFYKIFESRIKIVNFWTYDRGLRK